MHYKNINLELLSHDTVRITTNKNHYLYIDPYQLPQGVALPKADVLLISHTHADHCSLEDIRKILQPSTHIFTVADAQSKFSGMNFKKLHLLRPGKTISFDDTDHEVYEITAVPAYNTNKYRSPGVPFHPQENEWIGFIIRIDGTSVYFAGDTDNIPQMASFPHVNIALLPVSGTYVMTAQEASSAAETLRADITIPMHYGAIIGNDDDAQEFVNLAKAKGLDARIIRQH